jgi:hypothetical protein
MNDRASPWTIFPMAEARLQMNGKSLLARHFGWLNLRICLFNAAPPA